MAKLVVLSEGLRGKTHELKGETTTLGRVEDNAFQIPDQSVSSHHCEVLQRGGEVIIKDLQSTNGTYINGEKITEAALKPGQILRLGSLELKLDDGSGTVTERKTRGGAQGVKLNEFDQGTRQIKFDKDSPFAKKSNKIAMVFIVIGVLLGLIILVSLIIAFQKMQ